MVWNYVTWGKLGASVFLILCSALFAGLTLGLLGLDIQNLQIIATSGSDEKEREYAKRILPLRKRGNLLLCTLLLGNVMVNSAISILMADIADGALGFVVSTALITVFGEIIPQAFCSRYGLAVGYYTSWIVKIFMVLVLPVSFPLSWALDKALGAEIGTIYSKAELKSLVQIHAQHQSESGLAQEEAVLLGSALDFHKKTAVEVMTPFQDVFMLEVSEKLDVDCMTRIWQTGHSRIPVYECEKNNIIGLLYVKDLILVSADDELPLRTMLTFYGNQVHKVFSDKRLYELMNEFKAGKSHLAIVQKVNDEGPGDPFYEAIGIVTLEDVIEELISSEIIDETDVFADNRSYKKVGRDKSSINLFARKGKSQRLTPQQVVAVCSYLQQTLDVFKIFAEENLKKLLSQSLVVDINVQDGEDTFIYKKGVEDENFTLVLHGKLEVCSGEDKFLSESGPWSFLAVRALSSPSFVPDFSARVLANCKLLRINKKDFVQAVIANAMKSVNPNAESPLIIDIRENNSEADGFHRESKNSSTANESSKSTVQEQLAWVHGYSETQRRSSNNMKKSRSQTSISTLVNNTVTSNANNTSKTTGRNSTNSKNSGMVFREMSGKDSDSDSDRLLPSTTY